MCVCVCACIFAYCSGYFSFWFFAWHEFLEFLQPMLKVPAQAKPTGTMAESETRSSSKECALGAFYATLSAIFTVMVIVWLILYPLFPIQESNASWSSMWLLMAVLQYYHMAAVFCGIVVATEATLPAIIWCLLILLLGAPFATFYTAKQIGSAGTLKLLDNYIPVESFGNRSKKAEKPLTGFWGYSVAAGYVVIGLAFAAKLVSSLIHFPLVPLATGDAEWANAWLITTVLDFYTIAVCVMGVIIATDNNWVSVAFCAGILLLTGPPGSAWVAQRLFRKLPLALEKA